MIFFLFLSFFFFFFFFFFSSRRRHTRWPRDWSSDVCSSDLNNIAHRQVIGIPSPALKNAQHEIARCRGVDHPISIGYPYGEWFLTHNVLAGVQRRKDRIQMRAWRRADHDETNLRVVEHLLLTGVHANRPFARGCLATLLRQVADRYQSQAADRVDRSRVFATDRTVTNQADSDRRGCLPTCRVQDHPAEDLLERRVLISRRMMAESHVDEPAVAVGALICDDLLGESPAGAQQDVRIERRAFAEVELVPHLPLHIDALRDRMLRIRPDDQLGQWTRATRNPTRELAYCL